MNNLPSTSVVRRCIYKLNNILVKSWRKPHETHSWRGYDQLHYPQSHLIIYGKSRRPSSSVNKSKYFMWVQINITGRETMKRGQSCGFIRPSCCQQAGIPQKVSLVRSDIFIVWSESPKFSFLLLSCDLMPQSCEIFSIRNDTELHLSLSAIIQHSLAF